MRLIRASEHRCMPWKNGGGETSEIVASPPGATLDAFDWRISMAQVGVSGPFSAFPGVDRTLSVLGPAGIALDFGGRGTVQLDQASAPYSFPADLAVEGRLLGGPLADLNVMSRRGRFRHQVWRRVVEAPIPVPRDADAMVILAIRNGVRVVLGAQSATLAARDAAVIADENAGEVRLHPEGPAEIFIIELWRAAAPLLASSTL